MIIQINCFGTLGTCVTPRAILYTGSCISGLEYVDCTPGNTQGVAEYTVTGLTVGLRYYLYIESEEQGTLQLCIDDFIPQPIPEADCEKAVILCNTDPFSVESLNTEGDDLDEFDGFEGRCLDREFNSSWYKWTCDDSGTLTFTITPNNFSDSALESDDIDFAVFELINGIDDCTGKEMIRCMASGGCSNNFMDYLSCTGPTGLSAQSTDVEEFPGCFGSSCGAGSNPGVPPEPDDNFISGIDMVSGRSYALVVMNFTASGQGFGIEFDGTGTFLGPDPDFEPMITGNFVECDKEVTYMDQSDPGPDPIVEWSWNFGAGAIPPVMTGIGPHPVTYESFGDKFVTLTVESSKGCVVTRILPVTVEPCCFDLFPGFDVTLEASSLVCPGETNGEIIAQGINGSPEYLYTITGPNTNIELSPQTNYDELGPGTYTVDIIDSKGCESTGTIEIVEADEVLVDAGVDVEIELGFLDTLDASVDPPGADVTYAWGPEEGLDCEGSDLVDCPDPIVIAPGNTTYTVTITDENGCTATDMVDVRTIIVRPIYEPNVMLINSPLGNDEFRLGFGRQAERVETFIVYDRWGSPIYEGRDIELDERNERVEGWDGRFGGDSGGSTDFVNPGVYVWYAEVLFIDGVTLPYAGDVTVIR